MDVYRKIVNFNCAFESLLKIVASDITMVENFGKSGKISENCRNIAEKLRTAIPPVLLH